MINRFGPVREVEYSRNKGLVLEIAFEGINWSSRHKSGIALRFPRINRIRSDWRARGADRIGVLEGLLREGVRRRDLTRF
jgi:DNA ligase-1